MSLFALSSVASWLFSFRWLSFYCFCMFWWPNLLLNSLLCKLHFHLLWHYLRYKLTLLPDYGSIDMDIKLMLMLALIIDMDVFSSIVMCFIIIYPLIVYSCYDQFCIHVVFSSASSFYYFILIIVVVLFLSVVVRFVS